jgi:uncharacterized repeat protein (TIGR03803 family)
VLKSSCPKINAAGAIIWKTSNSRIGLVNDNGARVCWRALQVIPRNCLAAIVWFVLATAFPFFATGQIGTNYARLHSFGNPALNLGPPQGGLLLATDGLLYGITPSGGAHNRGTIFRVGQDGKNLLILHSFSPEINEITPASAALVEGPDGALYGAAALGGDNQHGAIFRFDKAGSNFSVLHHFRGAPFGEPPENFDGAYPVADLIVGSDGALYGTTFFGGAGQQGTVFRITPDGSDYSILHSFGTAPDDGRNPCAALLQARDGFLYGTTSGTDADPGTIFRLAMQGGTFDTLFHFPADRLRGAVPCAALVELLPGILLGTTSSGGKSNLGTIFRITSDGSNQVVLHSFSGGRRDGSTPTGRLVLDGATLYGMTSFGGSNYSGTLFSIRRDGSEFAVRFSFGEHGSDPIGALAPARNGRYFGLTTGGGFGYGTLFCWRPHETSLKTLFQFSFGGPDASMPQSILVEGNKGALFGTAFGGAANAGAIFTLRTNGQSYKILHSFTPNSNGYSATTVTADNSLDRLFGMTQLGGRWGVGTLFSLRQDGSDFKIIHHFGNPHHQGFGPFGDAKLLIGSDGWLYGALAFGDNLAGSIFRLNKDGSNYRILHKFDPSGEKFPVEQLIEGSDGFLYGTTTQGGSSGKGSVFRIARNGSGYSDVYTFTDKPFGALFQASDGLLYGAAGNEGPGFLYRLNKDGSGYSVIHTFTAWPTDGDGVNGPLVEANDGFLYGTTVYGGLEPTAAVGTIFRLHKDGSSYSILHSFSLGQGGDGSVPVTGLIKSSGGDLYGTTQSGGDVGVGTVFAVYPELLVAPVLRTQPYSQRVMAGTNVIFAATADGTPPLAWQWFFNGQPLPQETNAALQIPIVHTNAVGVYSVQVSNTFGSAASAPVSLELQLLQMLTLPDSQAVPFGSTVTFSASAFSLLPLWYQWWHGYSYAIPGATNSNLTLTNVQDADQGDYYLCLGNQDGDLCLYFPATLTLVPTWSVEDSSVLKVPGQTNFMEFHLHRLGDRPDDLVLNYSTSTINGSALAGTDFLSTSGFATFPAGVSDRTVQVPIIGAPGADPKCFSLYIYTTHPVPPNDVFARHMGTGWILSSNFVPQISLASNSIPEGDSPHVVYLPVTLSGPATQPVTVDFNTVDGSARTGVDYVAASGKLAFAPMETNQMLSLTILGNALRQTNRNFYVYLSNPVNATVPITQVLQTIADDDTIIAPDGFSAEVIATNLLFPTRIEFAPDGRLFVTGQEGDLRIVKDGSGSMTPFLHVDTSTEDGGEAGLLGVAFDPGFATNKFVYVYYTAFTPYLHNRISRFTAAGDAVLPGSEHIVLDLDPLPEAFIHNGGALHFGPDGMLYAGVGENGRRSNSQSYTNLLGKILRFSSDGTIPADNPFYSTAIGPNRAIWALGLRNPFSFAFQPGTGRMLINDVGEDTWEEINEGLPGANYGWPNAEGPSTNSAYRNPAFYYGHNPACAIVGATFYNPARPQFPGEYIGKYFFADLCGGWIRTLSSSNTPADFITGIPFPIDIKTGPDGALYCLGGSYSLSAKLYRFSYNHPMQFRSVIRTLDGRIELHIDGTPGRTCILESSPNLINWQPLSTNVLQSPDLNLYDSPGDLPQRFYRIRED